MSHPLPADGGSAATALLIERVERHLADPTALGAALRARAAGAPDALVLAALLHGSADGFSVARAEDRRQAGRAGTLVAAAWLGRTFGPAVAEPVRLLGDAMRWLATVDRAWFEALDVAGLDAVRALGGPLAPAALRSFERRPYSADAICLARWIDAERRAGGTGSLPHDTRPWSDLVRRVLRPNDRASA